MPEQIGKNIIETAGEREERKDKLASSWQYRVIIELRGRTTPLGCLTCAILGRAFKHGPAFSLRGYIDKSGIVHAEWFADRHDNVAYKVALLPAHDFQNYFRSLADKLKLLDKEREEMFSLVNRWIAFDQRALSTNYLEVPK